MKTTKEHRNWFIACAIGDGHIDKNGTLTIFHCKEQKELVLYKMELLKPFLTHKQILTRKSNDTYQYGLRCRTSKFSKLVRRLLYPNGVKTLSLRVLKRLSEKHFALWWMDDGSCSTKKNKSGGVKATVSTLSTHLDKEQNQLIIDYIKEAFNVRFGQRKSGSSFSLICGTREGRLWREVISPYIIPSMEYKLSR